MRCGRKGVEKMPRKLLFENVTCSRCGGSGKFSYCSMYGSVCFKCHGDGVVLTKKGRAAQMWLNAKKRKPLGEVAVGDWVLSEGVPGYFPAVWVKIDTVEGEGEALKVSGLSKKGERHGFGNAAMVVRLYLGKARNAELAAEAKAFEATLTKSGTERKRKAAKAAPAEALAEAA
jgi:hypothetical protein